MSIPRITTPGLFSLSEGMIIDLFAGGGGASIGIEQAFAAAGIDRHVDVAINHDPDAIACHERNHPLTTHLQSDVFEVDPEAVTEARRVALIWASPDCTDFSKAKGGRPNRSIKRRSLAWVVVRWAFAVQPEVIMLENVEEFEQWGPLDDDGQPVRDGSCFADFTNALRHLGYDVEHRVLKACDYGTPTTRKRLFLVARRDGRPIVWPEQTHGLKPLKPHRTAAEIIDWSEPMLSIFATPEQAKAWARHHGRPCPRRPLAENTMRRIAAGTKRYVLDAAEPFVLSVNHGDTGSRRTYPIDDPLGTVTQSRGHALVVPSLIQTGYGEREGQRPRVPDIHSPLGTVVGGGSKHALVAAFMAKHYGGVVGHDLRQPMGTVTTVDHHSLVAAFLAKYYGSDIYGQAANEPLHTIPTVERFGLVTVMIDAELYVVCDILMRMLMPRELARAQGFGDDYVIDERADGKKTSKRVQVRLIGNSVCPPMSRALTAANVIPHWHDRHHAEAA